MSKSKHTKRVYERNDYEDVDDWRSDPDAYREKHRRKRLDHAIKTKNIDELLDMDEYE